MSVAQNLSLVMLRSLHRCGLIRRKAETQLIQQQMRELMIRAAGLRMPAETLSGGNQQKLVIGKWLASQPKVLILDEPTRGIDVGAKAQVHQLIRQMSDQGMATLIISSELPELLGLCDRILVMRQGRMAGVLSGESATQEQILQLALPDADSSAPILDRANP
jgi:ABC-type sugar transport system ATPase subunit